MLWHARDKSPVFDEIGHLQAGYYHWEHKDFERGLEHPPLLRLWAALPLQFMNLTDPEALYPLFLQKPLSVTREQLYGTMLIYRDPNVSPEKIVFAARLMMIAVTLLLLWVLFAWSRDLYGLSGGLLSLFLGATFPPFLGHGSIVNTDVGGAAFGLLFLYALSRLLHEPSLRNLVYCGFILGLAQASKLSNVVLFPIAFVLTVLYPGVAGKKHSVRVLYFLALAVASALVLNACYRFQDFIPPHGIHPNDLQVYQWSAFTQFLYRWAPLPDFYLLSLGFLSHHLKSGFSTFLLGKTYSQGVWYYFPVLFLVRTPTVALLSIFAAFYSLKKLVPERREFILIFSAAAYILTALFSKLNLGIRHFLFVYPLLFIFCGRLAFWKDFLLPGKSWAIGLGLFHILEVAWISPHYLTFYNLISGGPRAGRFYSSDLDYGQDLKRLGLFMKKYPGAELVLSYFGTALPEAYGIGAQELLPAGTLIHTDQVNSDHPSREFLAVSVSQIQGLMTGEGTLGWLKSRKPAEVLGYSIYVYDITRDRDAHERLAKIYREAGDARKSEHHLRRARSIS